MTKAMPLVLSGREGKPHSAGSGPLRTALVCLCLLFSVGTPAQQQGIAGIGPSSEPTFTTFEAPDSGTGNNQGTVPFSINTAGNITGTYLDRSTAYHGFVRAADGKITTFKAPGSGTGAAEGTIPFSINTAGDITGTYLDTRNVYHGFVRTP